MGAKGMHIIKKPIHFLNRKDVKEVTTECVDMQVNEVKLHCLISLYLLVRIVFTVIYATFAAFFLKLLSINYEYTTALIISFFVVLLEDVAHQSIRDLQEEAKKNGSVK